MFEKMRRELELKEEIGDVEKYSLDALIHVVQASYEYDVENFDDARRLYEKADDMLEGLSDILEVSSHIKRLTQAGINRLDIKERTPEQEAKALLWNLVGQRHYEYRGVQSESDFRDRLKMNAAAEALVEKLSVEVPEVSAGSSSVPEAPSFD